MRRTTKKAARITSFSDYKVDQNMELAERVADFFNWAAIHLPYRYIRYNELFKIVNQRKRKPAEDSKELELFRNNCMRRVRLLLPEQYDREFDYKPGEGVRATVDDADKARTVLQRQLKGLHGKSRSIRRVLAGINENNIDDPELRSLVVRAKEANKMLMSPTFQRRIALPPKPKPPEPEK